MTALGFTLEVISNPPDGAHFEFEVVGKARGVVAQPHVHEHQTERFEVIEIRHEPAGESEAFFVRLAELSRNGGYDPFGMPKPKAGARIIRDFPAHRSALVPVRAQRAFSRALLRREPA